MAAKTTLPYPLAPPYYVNRTDAWQARVMEAARSYFRPAEFADLQRLEIRFVMQEAERIKRHLRRRGDYAIRGQAGSEDMHPARSAQNTALRRMDVARTNFLTQRGAGDGPVAPNNQLLPNRGYKLAPSVDPDTGRPVETYVPDPRGGLYPVPATGRVVDEYDGRADALKLGPDFRLGSGRLPREESLSRRTQLFIASIFVFDQAHALLRHLREECLSLTSAGTETDESLLKQIVPTFEGSPSENSNY